MKKYFATGNTCSWLSMWGACIALLVCSVALNLILARKVKAQAFQLTFAANSAPKEGQRVPSLSVENLNGSNAEIRFGDSKNPTVIYAFTPTCHWCARNLENLKSLYAQAGTRFRFIAVSLATADLSEYVNRAGIQMPIYQKPSAETTLAFHLSATPEMWIVNPDGVITHHWAGAWSGESQREVSREFGVTLPGLLNEQSHGNSR